MQEVSDWSSEEEKVYEPKEKVSDRDKFKLAKWILLAALFCFLLLAAAKIFIDKPGTTDVWNFGSVALNSIVSLVIGFYFREKFT